MVDQNEPRDRWHQVKAKITAVWSNLSDEELDSTKGNISEISSLILSKGEESKQEVAKKLVDIMHSVEEFETFKHAQLGINVNQRL